MIEVKLTRCPKCNKLYNSKPAISRVDNCTLICSDCGMREALDFIGVEPGEADRIIDIVRKHE